MAKSKSNEVVIYLGPTIKNVVATGTVFNNGLPKNLVIAIEQCPPVNELIVPLSEIATSLKNIQNKKGSTYAFYRKVKSFFNSNQEEN